LAGRIKSGVKESDPGGSARGDSEMGRRRGLGGGSGGTDLAGARGTASGAVALIEVEVRDGLGPVGIAGGRLVDVEVAVGVEAEVRLGRAACG